MTMTRINCGISPSELSNKHLCAEHREIKRIPNCVAKGRFDLTGQPPKFKLGTGHVKFFYDKCGYLKRRYEEIYSECVSRGLKVAYYGESWDDVPAEMMGDYEPTEEDCKIVRQRILDKLSQNGIE